MALSTLSALILLFLSTMLVIEGTSPLAGDLALNMTIVLVSVISSVVALIWLFASIKAISSDEK